MILGESKVINGMCVCRMFCFHYIKLKRVEHFNIATLWKFIAVINYLMKHCENSEKNKTENIIVLKNYEDMS